MSDFSSRFNLGESDPDADEFGDAAIANLDCAKLMRNWVDDRPNAYDNVMKVASAVIR